LSFGVVPCGGLENYSGGFLPASQTATMLHAEGVPIDNIRPAGAPLPDGRGSDMQRVQLELLRAQDADFARSTGIESAIRNYELAYRMQSLVPDVLDLSRESLATHRLYGIDSNIPSKRLYGISVCERGGSSNQACASSRSPVPPARPTAPGTSTANLKAGHEKERPRYRSGDCGPHQGPEAARFVRRDA